MDEPTRAEATQEIPAAIQPNISPVATPAPPQTDTTSTRGGPDGIRLALAALALIAIGAAVVFAVLWANTRAELEDAQAKQASDTAAAQAAASERPNLRTVTDKWLTNTRATVHATTTSAEVVITDSASYSAMSKLEGMLEELGFSKAVSERMGHTRALDGTLSAQGNHVNVTWTYHPDDGLSLVFEVAQ